MKLKVKHSLKYTYTDEVQLNPHYLYLDPKLNAFQEIISSQVEVLPTPNNIVKNLDLEENFQQICFFDETPVIDLTINASFEIKSEIFSPLNFVIYPFEAVNIPLIYSGNLAYLAGNILNHKAISDTVKNFSESIAEKSKHNTLDFLLLLAQTIQSDFIYLVRTSGESHLSHQTLEEKTGSCRDFAVLMQDCCAVQGLVTKFVSGYLYGQSSHNHELHAWVEVFIPGGGWRGFDPTEGRMVDHHYIAMASSIESEGLSPVRGSFRSKNKVESELATNVEIFS